MINFFHCQSKNGAGSDYGCNLSGAICGVPLLRLFFINQTALRLSEVGKHHFACPPGLHFVQTTEASGKAQNVTDGIINPLRHFRNDDRTQ